MEIGTFLLGMFVGFVVTIVIELLLFLIVMDFDDKEILNDEGWY